MFGACPLHFDFHCWKFIRVYITWYHDIIRTHSLRTDAEELQEELRWASTRPESRWKTGNDSKDNGLEAMLTTVIEDGDDETIWEHCLTASEHKFYMKYLEQYPDSCYSLNQDPDHTPMYARGKARIVSQITQYIWHMRNPEHFFTSSQLSTVNLKLKVGQKSKVKSQQLVNVVMLNV